MRLPVCLSPVVGRFPLLPLLLLQIFLISVSTRAYSAESAEFLVELKLVDWIHGAPDCTESVSAADYQPWQQVQLTPDTYIFRQNKCANYEGPFVYLFLGSEAGLLIDTGATEDGGAPLLQLVRNITALPITVAHSHGHGDHRLGDDTFRDAEGMTVVEVGRVAVERFFEFTNWPNEVVSLDLGDRKIEMLPIPGHTDDDLAYFDAATGILITGDSLYPGRLYVRNWAGYRDSVNRLADWIADKSVVHVLGTHIEMTATANADYPIGTTYQPNELPLPLTVADLIKLRDTMNTTAEPERKPLDSFIIWPVQ